MSLPAPPGQACRLTISPPRPPGTLLFEDAKASRRLHEGSGLQTQRPRSPEPMLTLQVQAGVPSRLQHQPWQCEPPASLQYPRHQNHQQRWRAQEEASTSPSPWRSQQTLPQCDALPHRQQLLLLQQKQQQQSLQQRQHFHQQVQLHHSQSQTRRLRRTSRSPTRVIYRVQASPQHSPIVSRTSTPCTEPPSVMPPWAFQHSAVTRVSSPSRSMPMSPAPPQLAPAPPQLSPAPPQLAPAHQLPAAPAQLPAALRISHSLHVPPRWKSQIHRSASAQFPPGRRASSALCPAGQARQDSTTRLVRPMSNLELRVTVPSCLQSVQETSSPLGSARRSLSARTMPSTPQLSHRQLPAQPQSARVMTKADLPQRWFSSPCHNSSGDISLEVLETQTPERKQHRRFSGPSPELLKTRKPERNSVVQVASGKASLEDKPEEQICLNTPRPDNSELPRPSQDLQPVVIDVTVPEGSVAGDLVDVAYGSLQLQAPVPEGMRPGETFRVEWWVGIEAHRQEQIIQKLSRWEQEPVPHKRIRRFMWNMLQAWHLEQLEEVEWRPHPVKGTPRDQQHTALPQPFRSLREMPGRGVREAPVRKTGDDRALLPATSHYKFVKFDARGALSDCTKELPRRVERGDMSTVRSILKEGKPFWPSEHFGKIEALKRVRGLSLKVEEFLPTVEESYER